MTITQPLRTRRTHSEAFKQSLIEACGEPGASVAGVALANGINANQLRRWMRERGIEPPELSCLPLRVAASEPMGGFVPVQLSPSVDPPIRVELRKGTAVVTVEWSAVVAGRKLTKWSVLNRYGHPEVLGQDGLAGGLPRASS